MKKLQIEPGSWQARFLSFVARPRNSGCWLWYGATQQQGYGLWTFMPPDRPKKKMQVAHRVMWELFNGPIEKGMDVDHLCSQKSCVNIDHLEAVTHKENMRRAWASKRNAIAYREAK